MSNQFFETRPGKGGVRTIFITREGADVIFTMRIAKRQFTWKEISAVIGCPVTSLRRAARVYFGDNPSVFTSRRAPETRRGRFSKLPHVVGQAPEPVPSKPKPKPVVIILAPEPEPKDKLLVALVAAFGARRPDRSEVRLKGVR